MPSYARQPLGGWRNEACLIPITVPNLDLTGKVVRAQIRQSGDNPVLTLDLPQTVDPAASGIRFVSVTIDPVTNLPTSHLMWQITMAAMQGLPFAGELGDAWVGAYALQIDGHTRLTGPFAALASPIDSDSAPANRPIGFDGTGQGGSFTAGVVLTIGDSGVTVSVDGSDLIAPLVRTATLAAASASVSAAFAGSANASAQDAKNLALGAASAITLAIKGLPSGTTLPIPCASRLILAAVANPSGAAYLYEGGRSGFFVWNAADISALVTIDPQQGVCVPPSSDTSGKSGAWVRVHTSGEVQAEWFGVVGDAVMVEPVFDANNNIVSGNTATGTDDTVAVQAASDFVAANGGGTVVFPARPMLIAGNYRTHNGVNCQIELPFSSDVDNEALVQWTSAVGAPLSGGTHQGPIFVSTRVDVPDVNQIWSVIGCGGPNSGSARSWTSFYMDNITVRVPQDSPISGVDLRYVHQWGMNRPRIDVIGGFAANGPNGVSLKMPTHVLQYGILGGYNNLPLWNVIREVTIFGYRKGLFVGELTGVTDLCVSACYNALVFPPCQHPSWFGRVLILSCVNTIQAVGPHETHIDILDIEHTPLPAGWDARAYDLDNRRDDGSVGGDLRGNITWHISEAPYKFTVSSGAAKNVVLHNRPPWEQSGNYAGDLIFPNFADVTILSGLTRTTTSMYPGFTPWHSLEGYAPGATDAVGVVSFTNFSRQGPDFRGGQINCLNNGSVDNTVLNFRIGDGVAGGGLLDAFQISSTGIGFMGKRLLTTQQPAITSGTDPTVNAILAAMRAHGLIAT